MEVDFGILFNIFDLRTRTYHVKNALCEFSGITLSDNAVIDMTDTGAAFLVFDLEWIQFVQKRHKRHVGRENVWRDVVLEHHDIRVVEPVIWLTVMDVEWCERFGRAG